MFKRILIATTAVVSLAGAAHAQQIPSVDTMCAQPIPQPTQQVVCSSPRLRANAQRNLNALIPLARSLSQPEIVAGLQAVARRSNEHMTYTRSLRA
jgi:hypothetical protein